MARARIEPNRSGGTGADVGCRLLLVFVVISVVAACLPCACQVSYVTKQALGQLSLIRRQEPLDSPEVRERLDARRQEMLDWIPRILAFCEDELGLAPGDAYTTWFDTGGEPISTIVLASQPLGLQSYRWCFPIAGCVPYHGHFDADDARDLAWRLRQDGWDVAVLPVGAYSTLGWFRDPVLSTMLDGSFADLVELLIHETVHRTVYWPDHTSANESLATWIAADGTDRFFSIHPHLTSDTDRERRRLYAEAEEEDEALQQRLRIDLETLYASTLPDEAKRRRKAEIFRAARRARSFLWGVPAALPASNAYVTSFSDYHDLVGVFAALQEELGGHPRDLVRWLAREREESEAPPIPLNQASS